MINYNLQLLINSDQIISGCVTFFGINMFGQTRQQCTAKIWVDHVGNFVRGTWLRNPMEPSRKDCMTIWYIRNLQVCLFFQKGNYMCVYIYNILYISGCARVWGDLNLDRAQLKTTRPAIRSKMLVFVHCQIIFSDTGKQENRQENCTGNWFQSYRPTKPMRMCRLSRKKS